MVSGLIRGRSWVRFLAKAKFLFSSSMKSGGKIQDSISKVNDYKADQDPEIWFVQKFRVQTLDILPQQVQKGQ